ncbi:PerC family transcriptional regulator [Salmonella enterica]|nr:PerC family transcriptional regulator [Salmonella enterica]EGM2645629.1 PerC family transcriptional regulator [Salmonella enterica]EGM2983568.1 PerC family transcriptional regulator [Salmonella enterica]EJU6033240.1 PerC family transcriptional regulator [Salmonella enterica]
METRPGRGLAEVDADEEESRAERQENVIIVICSLLLLILLCVMPWIQAQATEAFSPDILCPERGVVCDRVAGFCADSQGVSVVWTARYLGREAQSRLLQLSGRVSDFHTDAFTLSNGVHCESKKRTCWTGRDRQVSEHSLTEHLYGGQVKRRENNKSQLSPEVKGMMALENWLESSGLWRRAERQWREVLLQTLPEALQDRIRKKRNHCVRRVNEVRNRPERG